MTSPAPLVLTELELDALTEVMNIGVTRAAVTLHTMVGEPVLLSVPSVVLVSRDRASEIIGNREADRLVAVQQRFEGDISGRALLIFPETNSLQLVRAVAGAELSLADIIELEQEALAETGNIILNACLATIANMLKRSLNISLPEILHGTGPDFFGLATPATQEDDAVLFLYINFTIQLREIRGYIAMIMDLPGLESLKTLIRELINRESGEAFDGPS